MLECNYLKPMHNKQDFEKTEEYRCVVVILGVKLLLSTITVTTESTMGKKAHNIYNNVHRGKTKNYIKRHFVKHVWFK